MTYTTVLEPFYRLSKDLITAMRQSGGGITDTEVRYMVDLYYQSQKTRIRINNQIKGVERDATKTGRPAEPHDLLSWGLAQFELFEGQVKRAMAAYVESHPMSWFFAQTLGIGPVIAAGLLAHIDIRKAQTAGAIWRFAGLDPSMTWEKGQKRPWNTQLKTLCWKAGDSFVKLSNRKDAVYGQAYRERKAYEVARNEAGAFAERAAHILGQKKLGKETDAFKAYSQGKFPAGHLDAMARRWTVKLFLSHLHWRWYETEYGETPPNPYVIEHMGHTHLIEPPQHRVIG